ncbi:MAG TPA: DedA family protein [Actinomycetota bacterium]|nr:DedA family protein [Actinomycetota bacterium]
MVDRIVELLRPYLSAPWGYAIVGAATFLENSVGAGVIVPGETLVILGGFYARIGNLGLAWVAFAAVLGAVLGDNLGYLIGRRFGRGFLERHGRKLLVTPERLGRADAYYRAHGGKTIFLGRFVPVVRSVGCIVAGVARMDWRRFFAYDLGGALLWGVGHSILGYAIGASYERWKGYLTPIGLAVLAALLLLIGVSKVLAARRSVRADLAEVEAEEGGDPNPGIGLQVGPPRAED